MDHLEAEVGHEDVRQSHRPVGLLPLLEDRHQRPPDGQPGPVEGGHMAALAILGGETDARPPRLEGGAV